MSASEQAPTVTSAPYPNGSLYVGDLRQEVGESDIYDAFKECGAILSVRVCRDVKDQHSLGYAYVNFQTPENAQKALDTLNGKLLKGKPCRVMWSRRDPTQRKSNEGNLYVKGLDKSVTLIHLQDVFSHFGSIASCKVQTKDDGTSLCYGFVQFEKVEDSEKALEAGNSDKEQFSSLGSSIVIKSSSLSSCVATISMTLTPMFMLRTLVRSLTLLILRSSSVNSVRSLLLSS